MLETERETEPETMPKNTTHFEQQSNSQQSNSQQSNSLAEEAAGKESSMHERSAQPGRYGEQHLMRFVLSLIAVGGFSFIGVFTETMMNVIFPDLMREFHIDSATVQWVTTAALLPLAAIVPLSVWFNRRFHFKQIFIISGTLFIVGALIAFWSPSFAALLVARVIQGAATGIIMPVMFNMVMEQAPSAKIALFVGFGNLVVSLAPATGPVFGGVMASAMPWRGTFLIILLLTVALLVLGLFTIRQSHEVNPQQRFSALQFAMVSLGLVLFMVGLQQSGLALEAQIAGKFELMTTLVGVGSLVVGIGLLAGFAYTALKSQLPLINMHLFQHRTITRIALACLFIQMCQLGQSFIVPNFSQIGLGVSMSMAGFVVLPGALLGALFTVISGRVYDAIGPKIPMFTGISVATAALVISALLAWHMNATLICLLYALYEVGYAFVYSNSVTLGLSSLPVNLSSDGNALINTLQQVGCALGTTVFAVTFSIGQYLGTHSHGLTQVQASMWGAQMAYIGMVGAALLYVALAAPQIISAARSRATK